MLSRRDFLKTSLAATGSAFLPAAPFHTTPYVQNISFRRASVLWKSPFGGRGIVEIKQGLSFSSSALASVRELLPSETALADPVYLYRADLENLSPSTEYRYRVSLNDGLLTPEDGFPFRTAGATSFDFLVFGDCGLGSEPQREIAQRLGGDGRCFSLRNRIRPPDETSLRSESGARSRG